MNARFVARLLDGEKMAALCREFDISRKTGYKIYERYKDYGAHGLTDRSRRPYRHANKLAAELERHLVLPAQNVEIERFAADGVFKVDAVSSGYRPER